MCLHQMAGGQGGIKRQLASQNDRGDDAREATGILAWGDWVGTADTQHVQHGSLWFQDGATAKCANFDGGHRDRDLERAPEAVGID